MQIKKKSLQVGVLVSALCLAAAIVRATGYDAGMYVCHAESYWLQDCGGGNNILMHDTEAKILGCGMGPNYSERQSISRNCIWTVTGQNCGGDPVEYTVTIPTPTTNCITPCT